MEIYGGWTVLKTLFVLLKAKIMNNICRILQETFHHFHTKLSESYIPAFFYCSKKSFCFSKIALQNFYM